MAGAIAQLVEALSWFVPLRTIVVALVVLAAIASPFWFESVRDRQIRGAVRRMVRAEPRQRAAIAEQVMRLAGRRPGRLVAACDAAIKYDLRDLRDRALAALVEAGAPQADLKRLRALVDKPVVRWRDPLEAVVRIEALLDAGLRVGAQETLEQARAAFPGDPDLARLAARVDGPAGDVARPA